MKTVTLELFKAKKNENPCIHCALSDNRMACKEVLRRSEKRGDILFCGSRGYWKLVAA